MAGARALLLLLVLGVAAFSAAGAAKSPPPKKPPPRKPPPKKPPPKKSPPRKPPPPPAPLDCSTNATGNYINGSGYCVPCPIGCANGGYCNVNTGACVCPTDAKGNPLTSGSSSGCGSCQPNLDPRTQCRTQIDLCQNVTVIVYPASGVASNFTVTLNATSQAYCDALAVQYGEPGQLSCYTDITVSPSKISCVCPPGAALNPKTKKCLDLNECLDKSYASSGYPVVDDCYNVGTTLSYNVTSPVYDDNGDPAYYTLPNGTVVYNTTEQPYILYPAYGATCVNLVYIAGVSAGGYNCTCPPCYQPTQLDVNGVVSGCDPVPYCQMPYKTQFLQLYYTDGDGFAYVFGATTVIQTPFNATPAFA